VFSTNFYHELEHWKIFYENWKDGYQTDLDLDNDGYNDEWEKMIAKSSKYQFSPDKDDTYKSNYGSNWTDDGWGTWYEEDRCYEKEKQCINLMNQADWSFDPAKNTKENYGNENKILLNCLTHGI